VHVQDTLCILAGGMNGAVNDEPGRIDFVRAVDHLLAVEIDLDQTGRGDLAEHQAVRIDQKVMLGSGKAGRDMGEDQIVPAEHGDQSIARRKVYAQPPFGIADLRTDFGGTLVHRLLLSL
jgi:hypothetical protein